MDFDDPKFPMMPNWCLAAPAGHDLSGRARIETPVYDVAADDLMERIEQAVLDLPSASLLRQDKSGRCKTWVVQTPLLKFSDEVTAEVGEAGEGSSELLLFSRSRIGITDLGTNRRRIEGILARLA